MTKLELLKMLERCVREYRFTASKSLVSNSHMNALLVGEGDGVPQRVIDAILVDFVNYIGLCQGIDYGLYTKHLNEEFEEWKYTGKIMS